MEEPGQGREPPRLPSLVEQFKEDPDVQQMLTEYRGVLKAKRLDFATYYESLVSLLEFQPESRRQEVLFILVCLVCFCMWNWYEEMISALLPKLTIRDPDLLYERFNLTPEELGRMISHNPDTAVYDALGKIMYLMFAFAPFVIVSIMSRKMPKR